MPDTALIFDLGKVLVDYEYQRVFDFLRVRGAAREDPGEFVDRTGFIGYESGLISDRQFYDNVVAVAREPFSFDEWAAVWTGIFTPMSDMLALFDRLAAHYPTFILSNISPLHFSYLDARLSLTGRSRGALTSCDAGVRKPAAEIYALAERQFGLTPGQIIFIDDREENVRAAQAAGWRAVQHESPATTIAALSGFGIMEGLTD